MDNSDYERLRDVVTAGHTGDIDLASARLDDPDAGVRCAALGAMARLGALRDDAIAGALGDPAPRVRRRAAELAAGRPGLARSLLSSLDDEDPVVAEVVAFALGESAPPDELVTDLVKALSTMACEHNDALCRESAVAALGSLGEPGGLDAVLAGCEDRATVRRRAVVALAAFDGTEVTATLERLTEDRDLQVRQAAEDLLAIERGEDS